MATLASPMYAPINSLETSESLLAALSTSAESFLQPSHSLHVAAILAAKQLLDPLASDVNQTQEQRRHENKKKRKRSELDSEASGQVLQLREVHTDGFGIAQIWEQARRVLDAANNELVRDLDRNVTVKQDGLPQAESTALAGEEVQMVHFKEDGMQELDEVEEELTDDEGTEALDVQDFDGIQDDDDQTSADEKPTETFVPDPNGLNDGFFSIDDFNRQSQFLEQKDARGEDDNLSDEDEIDWDADPLTMNFSAPKSSKSNDDVDDEDDEDDDDGPSFGNADLNAPFSEDDKDDGEEDGDLADGAGGGLDNTNDIQYADFFEPPPKRPSKTKRMRALPKTQPPPRPYTQSIDEDVEKDIERAISDVRRDLLESEDEDGEEVSLGSDADSEDDTGAQKPSKNAKSEKILSTHEKQKAAIAAEIRRLEAANVSKRDWTLSGEARAADRPVNSLIEEDLEFERVGKPVPVITAEVSEEIEGLIKRRILTREFDEVVRRQPDAVNASTETRRGRAAIELDDAKPQQGLAEVYEQEHLKMTDPGYVDKRNAGLKKQHDEISRLWKEVSGQLDILSNLHFRPKRPDVEVKIVGDKPTISMEDARPGAAAGGLGEESMLAPQEIYRPGDEGSLTKGEALGKSGIAVSKEEMTREEKLRRRRREKERGKKANGNKAAQQQAQEKQHGEKVAGSKGGRGNTTTGQERRDILSELKRGGVQVIGKKGNLEDLGKKNNKSDGKGLESASALKL